MSSERLNIDDGDYEQERNIFDMWRWINAKLALMEALPDFGSAFFKQSGRNVKKLIEEAMPIAFLGLRFVGLRKEVFVRCLTGNQPYDGTLRVEGSRGFGGLDLKVEVTTTENDETVFARQRLAETGSVHRPAKFEMVDGRKVPLPPEMVYEDELWREWIAVAMDRAASKVESRRYDSKTAILVSVNPLDPRLLPLRERASLCEQTRHRLGVRLSEVYDVYYLHKMHIDEIRGPLR